MRPILAIVLVIAACSDDETSATDLSAGLVDTTEGIAIGVVEGGVAAFRGIPFAQPPIGALRWRPPQPPVAYHEDRDATRFGPGCPQVPPPLLGDRFSPELRDESCLSLNVWTSAAAPGEARPVAVFIHGGGFTLGGAAIPWYDGQRLASEGGLVVVTFNYRLGALGFLAHPALSAEDPSGESGNYGLLDQIHALEWVRDNAREFGGDPGNVMIFGESAGAISVCALLASPRAAGLFHRAVMESGACPLSMRHLAEENPPWTSGHAMGQAFATALACPADDDVLSCLRGKTVDEILAAPFAPKGILPGSGVQGLVTVGTALLPESLGAAANTGALAAVPLIAGTNADEGTLALFDGSLQVATVDDYREIVQAFFADLATPVLAQYPAASDDEAAAAAARLLGDAALTCPTRNLVRQLADRGRPAYLYRFGLASSIGKRLEVAPGAPLGAFHGSELMFVFGRPDSFFAFDASEFEELSGLIRGYWSRFAATGDPNSSSAPRWSPYTTDADVHLQLEIPVSTEAGLARTACDLLSRKPF